MFQVEIVLHFFGTEYFILWFMRVDEPEVMGRSAIKVSFGPSHACCVEGWKIQAHEFTGTA